MATNLLALVDRVRLALEETGTLSSDDLQALSEATKHESHIEQALRFLHGRDEILIDAVDQSVHLRAHVTQAVLDALKAGPCSIESLDAVSPVSLGMICDVLGWLERDRRIVIGADDVVSLR